MVGYRRLGDEETLRIGDWKEDVKKFFRNTDLRSLKNLFHKIVTLSEVEG
jgi:hypothetical protein